MEDKRSALSKKIYDFIQSKPIWFCIVYILLFAILGYKVFSVVVLKDIGSGCNWATGFLKFSLSLLSIVFIKEIYGGKYNFYFQKKGLWQSILLGWIAWIYIISNMIGEDYSGSLNWKILFSVFMCNFFTGLFEEVTMRGVILQHMVYKFSKKKNGVVKAIFWSSFLFGIIHLGNLLAGNYFATFMQVLYAIAIGMIFGTIFLLTKNIWGVVILHWLVDASSHFYLAITYANEETITPLLVLNPYYKLIFLTVFSYVVAIFLLRKKNRQKICELWSIKESE